MIFTTKEKTMNFKKLRINSFVWGGLSAAALIALGVMAITKDLKGIGIACFVASVAAFTLVSCLILKNNFIEDVLDEIFSWGFVSLPGLIFELSLDGIIWLLTVKLLFWILGIALACAAGGFAIFIGAILSLFVYPFALSKNIREVPIKQ